MNTTFNSGKTAVRISGDFSPYSVYCTTGAMELLGGPDSAFHSIKALSAKGLLPRCGNSRRPLTERDIHYARENERSGYRQWRYLSLQGQAVRHSTGYDWVRGYGYETPNGWVIIDSDGRPMFNVTRSTK